MARKHLLYEKAVLHCNKSHANSIKVPVQLLAKPVAVCMHATNGAGTAIIKQQSRTAQGLMKGALAVLTWCTDELKKTHAHLHGLRALVIYGSAHYAKAVNRVMPVFIRLAEHCKAATVR